MITTGFLIGAAAGLFVGYWVGILRVRIGRADRAFKRRV